MKNVELLEQRLESRGNHGLKLHPLMCHGMVETEDVSMQTKTVQRVVAIAVFHITANGMPHVGAMHSNLVLTPRLQTELHERVLRGAVERVEMGDGIFATVIDG